MFAQNPKTGKPIRIMRSEASLWRSQKTFVWLKDQDTSIPWNRWDTCAVGVPDIQKWGKVINLDSIFLTTTSEEDYEWFISTDLSQYKMVFISRDMVYKVGEAKFRSMRLTNVICLEEATKMYPYLGQAWTGTAEDAVFLAGILLRNRKIVGLSEETVQNRVNVLREQGFEFQLLPSEQPKQLWYLTQYYKPEKGRREREIRECLEKNLACSSIDRVVLLNEKDLSKEWASMKGREKIQQEILGSRLTYKAVLEWIQTHAPPNILCVFANADIYLDADTWKDVWSVRTENVFFALLRWDLQDGEDQPAKLFGPRNDSQDTWLVDSDSVQKTTWDWASLDFPFGKAGCDNAITVEMLKKKFLVVNPALSLKTYHNHKTNIRNYDVADVVDKPIYLYVDPTGFHDMEPIFDVSKFLREKMDYKSFDRKLQSPQAKVLDVYCKMLERGERYMWKSQSLNTFSVESVPIYTYKHVFQTPQGLVYGLNKLFIGKEESSKEAWSKSQLSPVSPTYNVERAFAVPWREEEVKTPEGYLLYYLSKIHLLRKRYGKGEFWAPSKGIVPALEMFEWETRELPVLPHSPNVQIWCQEAIQYPWLNKQEIHKEEINALRSSLRKEWKAEKDQNRKWIVMIDGDLMTLDMVRRWEEAAPELEWGVVYQGSTSTEQIIEKLCGAEGFICAGGPNSVARWGLSWALPRGAKIIEIQNEMEPNGEAAHVSGAADLEHSLVIVPRASKEATKEAIIKHIKKILETVSLAPEGSSLPVIRMPSVQQGFFSHAGDSFREMMRLWEEKGYVRVVDDSNVNLWLGNVGEVLLYDRPTMDWLFASPQTEQLWKKALFGNPKPTESGGESSSWFFWPRRPRLVEEIVDAGDAKKSFGERNYRVVFYGKIENKVQEKRRLKENWEAALSDPNDEYKMVKGDEKYTLSQKEYLLRLADAKYGLCLAGFGKKCHREIECMAMGCVPLCASDVDMENYANPPVEGVHYLRVAKPTDINKVLETLSEEKWMEMSVACRSWWIQNASAEGSWALTKKLIQKI